MEHTQPLIEWPEPLIELLGFIASFVAVGAVAFRLRVIAKAKGISEISTDEQRVLDRAATRAAALGLLGAIVSAVLFAVELPETAARRHMTVSQALTTPQTMLPAALMVAAVLGLVLAARRVPFGWALAAIGVIVGPLTGAFFGQWNRLVVPIHRLAAGAWIGTLFMLVVAGIS